MFDGSTFCCDDDATALVDEFANGLTNVLPSTISFGLSSSTSCEKSCFEARVLNCVVQKPSLRAHQMKHS
uniref:Uncharacterized protein n=1 Tax=Tanacetum cinerariifolium TaxID=118510 RepID=A0A699TAZ7_TANCI|nr:hypothetical protein [Tanacetum cinerariifolium]